MKAVTQTTESIKWLVGRAEFNSLEALIWNEGYSIIDGAEGKYEDFLMTLHSIVTGSIILLPTVRVKSKLEMEKENATFAVIRVHVDASGDELSVRLKILGHLDDKLINAEAFAIVGKTYEVFGMLPSSFISITPEHLDSICAKFEIPDEKSCANGDVALEFELEPIYQFQIEKLYERNVTPSFVKSEDIDNQLDEAYYSPCTNFFTLIAHRLAYEILPNVQSIRLINQIEMTLSDLKVAISSSNLLDYYSQKCLKEVGIASLVTADISRCFFEYCRCMEVSDEIEDRVTIMHQSTLNTKAGEVSVDISLLYRFLQTDKKFVHSGSTALYPLLFIEFTTTSTKSVDEKIREASLYAKHLFQLMTFDEPPSFMPLLGVAMSESEMLIRLYVPSMEECEWKIAEVDIMRCQISTKNIERLLHIMVGWTVQCSQFLYSPTAASTGLSIYGDLFLRRHCNVVVLDKKVFKCFDYRKISKRSNVDETHRRDPLQYSKSDLTGVELVVDWASDIDRNDCLQIISYDQVPGVHCPSIVLHFILVMRKVAQLHVEGIVHGDLRFVKIMFSEASEAVVASTIIDFDHSGLAGKKIYPPRFNSGITDGFRHAGANSYNFLFPEHDIAALQWMCSQYHPKNVDLRKLWSSCVRDLSHDILDVADRLAAHEYEKLESVVSS